jgi:hypothetical protein
MDNNCTPLNPKINYYVVCLSVFSDIVRLSSFAVQTVRGLTVEGVLGLELHGLRQLHHVQDESLAPRQQVRLQFSSLGQHNIHTATKIPLMYSLCGNCAAPASVPISTSMCLCERFIYSQDQSTYFLRQNRLIDCGNI